MKLSVQNDTASEPSATWEITTHTVLIKVFIEFNISIIFFEVVETLIIDQNEYVFINTRSVSKYSYFSSKFTKLVSFYTRRMTSDSGDLCGYRTMFSSA